ELPSPDQRPILQAVDESGGERVEIDQRDQGKRRKEQQVGEGVKPPARPGGETRPDGRATAARLHGVRPHQHSPTGSKARGRRSVRGEGSGCCTSRTFTSDRPS